MMRKKQQLLFFALSALLLRPALPVPQTARETAIERQTNERQPPGKVLPAVGVKPGMVIGEVGAGRGRYTAHLAGLRVVRVETFLERDNIFILRVKAPGEDDDPAKVAAAKPVLLPFPPRSKERTAVIDGYLGKVEHLADRFASLVHRNADGEQMPYRLFTPDGRVPGRKYPLVVFLHGAGGSGTDNVKQLQGANVFGGLVWALPENQQRHPCFVVAPQSDVNWPCVIIEAGQRPRLCPGQRLGKGARLAFEIIDKLVAERPIEPSRIYVTGHSMGGAGVWHMIARRPCFFAAAVPVCGLPDFADAVAAARIPVWNFNGALDPIEPAERQRRWIAKIVKAGGDPIYTEYAGVEHDSFEWAYTEPALVQWMFAQRLARPAEAPKRREASL
ncbi:MAG TPA: alpha/beta hydrolase-fold protein [Terriglobales bacterium]|nr:alpha/beta hydrolase-fold protein [Terriglobales bacterium]